METECQANNDYREKQATALWIPQYHPESEYCGPSVCEWPLEYGSKMLAHVPATFLFKILIAV